MPAVGWSRTTTAVIVSTLLLAGCAGAPHEVPTIGAPAPSASSSPPLSDWPRELASTWNLTGARLPEDWPDIPLPRGSEVVTAYAIGTPPTRTWTATFSADRGTALDLAGPVVDALRERGYTPIAQYVGAAETNTGLYSFAAPTFAVYVVLGEDDGYPNVVITVRGGDAEGLTPSALPSQPTPAVSATPSTTPSGATTSSQPSQVHGSASATAR